MKLNDLFWVHFYEKMKGLFLDSLHVVVQLLYCHFLKIVLSTFDYFCCIIKDELTFVCVGLFLDDLFHWSVCLFVFIIILSCYRSFIVILEVGSISSPFFFFLLLVWLIGVLYFLSKFKNQFINTHEILWDFD